MAVEKEKAAPVLGFKAAIGIAALIGLTGGFLFGVLDSVAVILDHAPLRTAFSEMFFLALYSVALYAVIGCLGMIAMGAASGGVIRIQSYSINKFQLSGILIGVFVLLAVSLFLVQQLMFGSFVEVVVVNMIGIVGGAILGGLSVYVLGRVIRNERLIIICISLFVWLVVFCYGGLWVNLSLLPDEPSSSAMSLLATAAFFLFGGLLAAGLYVLSRAILRRYSSKRLRRAGYILLVAMMCAFITISILGPFGFRNSSKVKAPAASEVEVSAGSENLIGKPNILWIVMDSARADHLSSYGYYRNTTPNIDRIAGEGALFENAISAGPWSLPSHASMFTGMFPSKHGADAEHVYLDGKFQTIAEVLLSQGYRTFGYSNCPYVSRWDNLSQGFDTFVITPYGKVQHGSNLADFLKVYDVIQNIREPLSEDDGARRTNEIVKGWMLKARQEGRPFFVFINYMEAHYNYRAHKAFTTPYLPEGISLAKAMNVNQSANLYIAGRIEISDADFEIIRALYDGEISYLDFKMGELFDYLRELEIMDDTILVITADHGDNFGEHHLMVHKLSVYDTLLHVPLVIRYPEVFEAGLRVSEQVQLTDIYPTILDILGIDWDREQVQGYSLLRLEEERQPFAVAELAITKDTLDELKNINPNFDTSIFARRLKTIRTEEFKYIWASNGRDELYNIRQDPDELNNLIETEPEKARELKALLREWLNSFEPYRPGSARLLRD